MRSPGARDSLRKLAGIGNRMSHADHVRTLLPQALREYVGIDRARSRQSRDEPSCEAALKRLRDPVHVFVAEDSANGERARARLCPVAIARRALERPRDCVRRRAPTRPVGNDLEATGELNTA